VNQRPVPGRLNRRRRRSGGTVPQFETHTRQERVPHARCMPDHSRRTHTPREMEWSTALYSRLRVGWKKCSAEAYCVSLELVFLRARAEELSGAFEELAELLGIQHQERQRRIVARRLDADRGQPADREARAGETRLGIDPQGRQP